MEPNMPLTFFYSNPSYIHLSHKVASHLPPSLPVATG